MTARDETISIGLGTSAIAGQLTVPADALATVVFAHGSGSSRHSPRNRYVASVLQDKRLATLLFDLLTPEEEAIDLSTREYRFDIPFLAERLVLVTRWLLDSDTGSLPLGYFGASTGAAAALVAAAELSDRIAAVVSRGGRPDLAEAALGRVRAPTLLLVGGLDSTVLALNRRALEQLRCEKELLIVPGATHLFEEPGTLEAVAELAAQWFVRHARMDDSNAADP
jgi:pimeloyl-ACP methyl ester carboxylesterase